MKPDNPNDKRVGAPLVPQRSALSKPQVPARDTSVQAAAADIARGQLDNIYSGNTLAPTPQTTPVVTVEQEQTTNASQQSFEVENPYERTQANLAQVQADQWKHYHSAWQDYYQKYYERYYLGHVYRARQALEARAQEAIGRAAAQHQQAPAPVPQPQQPEELTHDEAMYDLRNKLLGKMQDSAKNVRKSRHFVPIAAATCVVLLFLFLQYNRVIFSNVQAYISPGDIDPANIIVDPSTNIAVSPEPKLIIPKINVDVPVVYNTKPDADSQLKAMESGVAYFGIPGANSRPGQIGNTVLSGHSSNDIIDQGDYKFIFARLDHLTKGDTIYVNYKSKRYTYTVTGKQVVKPTDVKALVYKTSKPILTLITCTPLGTATNRLLVTAEQVSPSPKDAKTAPKEESSGQSTAMPGNSPTFVQRLIGEN